MTSPPAPASVLAPLSDCVPFYEAMMADTLRLIVDRYARRRRFLDTKFSIITGQDFPPPGPARSIYDPDIVYGWLHGRALESLAGHLRWLPRARSLSPQVRDDLARRLRDMLVSLLEAGETLRRRNQGKAYFMCDETGQPLGVVNGAVTPLDPPPSAIGYADIFGAKGLFAAAKFLDRPGLARQAEARFKTVLNAVLDESFASDQQTMNPRMPVPPPVPGRFSHGPRMIALGGLALLAQESSDPAWIAAGLDVIHHVLDRHANHGQRADLALWDFWENADARGQPWVENGMILCNPGHTLEFVGFAAKFLLAAQRAAASAPACKQTLERCRAALPGLLRNMFELGFNAELGGIYVRVDLAARRPTSPNMPWWPLPETMRAAALVAALFPETAAQAIAIFRRCHQAFARYINPAVGHMAYQTRGADGKPVDAIPAVPDADPGYHTGLSMIDALTLIP